VKATTLAVMAKDIALGRRTIAADVALALVLSPG